MAERPAIVLVDHGSREAAANELLERVADLVRAREPGAHVEIAHMELAPPSLGEAIAACARAGARHVVVHPYFLGPGRHSTRDIPAQAAEARAAHPELRITVSEPLSAHPALADAVVERVREALSAEPGSGSADRSRTG